MLNATCDIGKALCLPATIRLKKRLLEDDKSGYFVQEARF